MASTKSAPGKKKTAAKTAGDDIKPAKAKKTTTKKSVAATPTAKAKPATKQATTTAKKPTASKTESAAKPKKATAAAKPASPEKPAAKTTVKKSSGKTKSSVSPEDRYRMICTAAYYLAECRGFAGGYEMEDWLVAEAQIDAKIKS